MRKIIIVAVILLGIFAGIGLRFLSPLQGQKHFNGASISEGVYFNCTPGQPGCSKQETLVHAWNQDLTELKVVLFHGDDVPAMKTLDGSVWTEINPATNQYFKIPKIREAKPILDTSDNCQGSAVRKIMVSERNILGYRAITYKDQASGWTTAYFPTLGCVGVEESTPMAASPGHVATTTLFVVESITASVNQRDFDPDPVGMQEVLPSTLYHDRVYSRLIRQGKTAAEAEEVARHPRSDPGISFLDKKWLKLH